ncbi:MAG: hypothetical protein HGA39_02855 [Coriobacteriia bacterium]|nr:hypothetical protein [Coriobacteriia bacterium]
MNSDANTALLRGKNAGSDSRRDSASEISLLMADRVGGLYAEEERRSRLKRTEDMIRRAQSLR